MRTDGRVCSGLVQPEPKLLPSSHYHKAPRSTSPFPVSQRSRGQHARSQAPPVSIEDTTAHLLPILHHWLTRSTHSDVRTLDPSAPVPSLSIRRWMPWTLLWILKIWIETASLTRVNSGSPSGVSSELWQLDIPPIAITGTAYDMETSGRAADHLIQRAFASQLSTLGSTVARSPPYHHNSTKTEHRASPAPPARWQLTARTAARRAEPALKVVEAHV